MATYLLINIAFFVATILLLRVKPHRPSKRWWITLGALCLLTAVFDSLLVYFSFIDYNADMILGLPIGFAPVEDFFYAVYAAVIVPLLWKRFEGKHD